ncbi:uncharacterized protein LOC133838695 [Drosophila sulfurigaster albostrigata]|uniref:uncharacterized protein LOC133838695 n=1 Tax=Drosophila sulfurigaster albostrigata TaxID=89887 RepID=UPI002D21BF91|nr:uncharacterized protein LOC133838695 [Drosophila sulfurigaster albostrigata]
MFKTLGIFLLLLIAQINATCVIDAAYGQTTNRIFATISRNRLEILRKNAVPNGTKLRVLCSETNYVDSTCRNGQFSPALPTTNCSPKPDPKHEAVQDASCPAPATMYRMGYRLGPNHFLEIYRSCYDVTSQRSLFSIHEIDSDTMNPPRTGCWRVTDVVVIIPSFQAKNIYRRFNEIFNNQQTYITSPGRPYKFNRGHLTPSADFGFCDQMRATFRYINVVAQFADVNDSNWSRVENWVRRMRDRYGKMTVCTGGIGVLELDDVAGNPRDIYLVRGNRNPVPEWTYKIIRSHSNRNIHYAVITYNHAENPVQPASLCTPLSCVSLGLQVSPAPNSGYTYCCDANDFILRNVQNLQNVC